MFVILHDRYGTEIYANLNNVSIIRPWKDGTTAIHWNDGWEQVTESMEEIKKMIETAYAEAPKPAKR